MTRAESWSRARVGYSLVQSFSDGYGTYRRDCSGFVSMAWALGSSYSTWTLPRVAHRLTKAGLRGDILLHRPSSGYGHMVIFDRWANRAHSAYVAYEQTPGTGDKHHTLPYPYYRNHGTYTHAPRRGLSARRPDVSRARRPARPVCPQAGEAASRSVPVTSPRTCRMS